MEFRSITGGRSVKRPAFDPAELVVEQAVLESEFSYEDARIDGGVQSGITGEGTLRRCELRKVDLSGATLAYVDLLDVRLSEVDLSNANVRLSSARRVELVRCRGIGLRLTLEHAADFSVQDSRLDYSYVEVGRVKGLAVFEECSFREAMISGDLSGVVFLNCDFTGAEFTVTRAKGCDLRGSRLSGVRGLPSLRGAQISLDQAVDVAEILALESGLIIER